MSWSLAIRTASFVPPYVGHNGWVGVRLDRPPIDWGVIQMLINDSYLMTAPKRLATSVSQISNQ
jgi:hypothetical protein